MAAATIGALSSPYTGGVGERIDGDVSKASFRRLSFASSHLSGDKLMPLPPRRLRSGGKSSEVRTAPFIVSPKAVSDSQNSQTCLDPDASRVSTLNRFI